MRNLAPHLAELRSGPNYRSRRILEGPTAPEIELEGRLLLNFSSNDYLGLANHPLVLEAFISGARKYGVGAGGAHLLSGHRLPHHLLEEELAAFTNRPRALLFSSGYMANLGAIGVLAGRHCRVYQDRLNHASLLEAARGAHLIRYPHAAPPALAELLNAAPAGCDKLLVTDGVFSMDGDLAPLPALAALAQQHHIELMVDDAHGLGVLGPKGGGTLEHYNLGLTEVPILMGTLGKALGTSGAFIAGSSELIETLIQEAKSYIYTTASPPAVAAATRAALRLVITEPERREQLRALQDRLGQGLRSLGLPEESIPPVSTAIQPLVLGSAERAQKVSAALLKQGILAPAIRPPTVPKGTARLRLTVTAAHLPSQIDRLLEALAGLVADQG